MINLPQLANITGSIIVLPLLLIELIIKFILLLILIPTTLVLCIFYPILKKIISNDGFNSLWKYATTIKHSFRTAHLVDYWNNN